MKTLLFSLFLLFSANTVFSQQHVEEYTDKLDGDIWVLDSVHHYKGYPSSDLYLFLRELVTSRNSKGDITSKLYLKKKHIIFDWENSSRYTQSFYDNGKKNEYKLQVYDSKRNIWIDSFQYKKYNNLGLLIMDMSFGYDQALGTHSHGYKVFKKYNVDKKVIESKHLIWDKDNQKWIKHVLELTDYSDSGNKKKIVSKTWVNGTNAWVNKDKKEWKYNSNNALIEYKTMEWVNNTWLNRYKKTIEYTSEGKHKMILNQNWNTSEDNWENTLKNVYEYDGDSALYVLVQQWNANEDKWKDFMLEIKKYNDAKLLIDNIKYYYPLDSTDELSGTRFLFYYNSEKKILNKLSRSWNDEKKVWENEGKWEYDYTDGNTVISSNWDTITIEWIPNAYYKYVLDSQGRTVLGLRKKWNIEESKWINYSKDEKEYDDYNHLLNSIYFIWLDDWVVYSKRHYFWSKFNTNNTDELANDGFVLFPNPAGNVLNLSYDLDKSIYNLQIYSLRGNQVLEISSPSYDKIDISQLVSGVYILKINTAKGTVSKLFSVEK